MSRDPQDEPLGGWDDEDDVDICDGTGYEPDDDISPAHEHWLRSNDLW